MLPDRSAQVPAKLRSFQHCRRDTDIVCFRLPEWCPLCGQATAATPCRIPPYVLPSPFVASTLAPRTVVVRPTNGTFLNDYSSSCDLHIGLTDSSGHVTEFDERGLTEASLWPECLVVLSCPRATPQQPPLTRSLTDPSSGLDPNPTLGFESWDVALSHLTAQPCRSTLWDKSRYNEQTWNCFDLVLHFMTLLRKDVRREVLGLDLYHLFDLNASCEDRRSAFCDRFLVEKCRKAGEYVTLYRRVLDKGYVSVLRPGRGADS